MSVRLAILSDLHLELGLPARARCGHCGAEITSLLPGDRQTCPCGASRIQRRTTQTRPRLIGAAEPLPPDLGYGATARAEQADVVLLAGDIHAGVRGIAWAAAEFAGLPVVYVAGNHEAHGQDLDDVRRDLHAAAARTANVTVLENAVVDLSVRGRPVRILGATLWTDFALYGDVRRALSRAGAAMSDFHVIRHQGRRWTPADAAAAHTAARDWLDQALGAVPEGMLAVVLTHHAPSRRSVAPQFVDDPLTPAFASNLEDLITRHHPDLWVHGHMHQAADYRIGRTRVVCHPRGFPAADPTWAWRPRVVETG